MNPHILCGSYDDGDERASANHVTLADDTIVVDIDINKGVNGGAMKSSSESESVFFVSDCLPNL